MNQKDYNIIAMIIKDNRNESISVCEVIAIQLADYFEKEDNTKAVEDKKNGGYYTQYSKFNREQFLKDCGIK